MIDPDDFTPADLDDFVFGNLNAKLILEELVSGDMPFPSFGKCGILFYGAWGTGKTTLAKRLPDLMEQARSGNDAAYDYHMCAMGKDGSQTIQEICDQASFVSYNKSGLHYFILDEIDNWTERTQQTLKAVMNYQHVVFVMTTNHIQDIDPGIISRSYLIQMDAATPADWLPVLHRVFTAAGVTPPPDATLLPIIESCNGNVRDIVSSAVRVANQAIRKAA